MMRSSEQLHQNGNLIDRLACHLIDNLVSDLHNATRISKLSEIFSCSILGHYLNQEINIDSLTAVERELLKLMQENPTYQPKILIIADIDGAQFDPSLYGQILASNPNARLAIWSGNPLNNLRQAKIIERIWEFIADEQLEDRTFFEASLLKFLAQPSDDLIQMALDADFVIVIGSTIVDVVNLDVLYAQGLDPKKAKLCYVGNHLLR